MKKLLFAILLSLPIMAVAGGDDAKYLAGAVPQKDGIVVFEKSFSVPGKTKAQMHDMLKTYLTQLVTQSIPGPTAYARMNMDTPDTIAARCCEMVFRSVDSFLRDLRQTRLLGLHQEADAPQPTWYAPQESRVSKQNGRSLPYPWMDC